MMDKFPFVRTFANRMTPVPIIAHILTKIKRWSFLAESSRPASQTKATHDLQDIEIILNWLKSNRFQIQFEDYPEKPKEDLQASVSQVIPDVSCDSLFATNCNERGGFRIH